MATAIRLLEAWMITEAVIMLPKVRGVLESSADRPALATEPASGA